MYQAIVTKYIGPSNVKGSRVKAKAEAGSLTLHWDDSLNSEQNHIYAAMQLAKKLGWDHRFHGGATPGSSGYTFVCENETVFTAEYEPFRFGGPDARIPRVA